jgi:t-SNARE syntaxin family protein
MSISKELYINYSGIVSKQEEACKELRKKLSNYQQASRVGNTNTISLESEIQRDIRNYKETQSQLAEAYSFRNAPSQIPGPELDRRQKEISQMELNIQEIENSFKNLQNEKYAYKGQVLDNYQQSEEMKKMSNSELIQVQKDKIKEQDEIIDDIVVDVKRGRVLAKEAGAIITDQNKQLDELQEDIDKLDSRMQRGIKRFERYVNKQSGCCIIIVLIAELVAAGLIYWLIAP